MSLEGNAPSADAAAAPARTTVPPQPPPGSARYFALLYTPAARRPALNLLMALADEMNSGLTRALDHNVAHARLDWWRLESERYARGGAQHPWLRSSSATTPPQDPALDLRSLVDAAAVDLAEGLQGGASGGRLHGALFVAAAALLGAAPLSAELCAQLMALGALTRGFERGGANAAAGADPKSTLDAALRRLRALHRAQLAPLLIWAELSQRRLEAASPLRAFADNIRAWRIARRASARP
jgi:hypothetical protein